MLNLDIRPEDIRAALESVVDNYQPATVKVQETGRVTAAADGIAHIEGLPGAMANELLEFESGVLGMALNLDAREIGVVVLGDFTKIEEGEDVRRTGAVLSVPVGEGYLGRVVDPLGNPIDGLGEIADLEGRRALEIPAPGVMQRQSVCEPLQTGIKAIDSMIPIGRGQRQLIIGDRQTGKTALAIDTIINQKDNWASGDPKKQVRCIYVAVGQKGTTIASVRRDLEQYGALEYTTIVASPASDPAGLKYLAPYTGSAIGQHWMYAGKSVLIVFDDLSKQADAYRAVSLLLRRPPGREAYPGDVFYLHSRLLERCAKLSDELGAGSMTGLPIVETKANDVSAFIPTNVISITDGQIFLQSDLFNADQRPAVDVGISVSRVGGDAQIKAMKKVAGTLKITLAQYKSLQAFAMFASDLDAASRAQLQRGQVLMELLKQPQFTPYKVEDQVISLWAATKGKMDDVPLSDVKSFEAGLLDYIHHNTDIAQTIIDTGDLDDATEAELSAAVEAYRAGFVKSDGAPLIGQSPLEDEVNIEQETIVTGPPEGNAPGSIEAGALLVPGGKQREYAAKIRSTEALQKVFRAQELIASSRIQRARDGNTAAAPFAAAITRAVSAVASHSDVDHPLTNQRHDTDRVGVLLIASDRGMAGSFTAGIIRTNENLLEQLRKDGKDPLLYVAGRRAVSYYHYRNTPIVDEWIYGSDRPNTEDADAISDRLLADFLAPADEGGVAEVHVVYTQFLSLVQQRPRVVRMLPLEVVEGEHDPNYVEPLYEFEPSVSEVLDALLPRYVRARIRSFMLESAASEVAARQQAMHSATDNAAKMIGDYTRKANAARQNVITQELTEIVSGADGLAADRESSLRPGG